MDLVQRASAALAAAAGLASVVTEKRTNVDEGRDVARRRREQKLGDLKEDARAWEHGIARARTQPPLNLVECHLCFLRHVPDGAVAVVVKDLPFTVLGSIDIGQPSKDIEWAREMEAIYAREVKQAEDEIARLSGVTDAADDDAYIRARKRQNRLDVFGVKRKALANASVEGRYNDAYARLVFREAIELPEITSETDAVLLKARLRTRLFRAFHPDKVHSLPIAAAMATAMGKMLNDMDDAKFLQERRLHLARIGRAARDDAMREAAARREEERRKREAEELRAREEAIRKRREEAEKEREAREELERQRLAEAKKRAEAEREALRERARQARQARQTRAPKPVHDEFTRDLQDRFGLRGATGTRRDTPERKQPSAAAAAEGAPRFTRAPPPPPLQTQGPPPAGDADDASQASTPRAKTPRAGGTPPVTPRAEARRAKPPGRAPRQAVPRDVNPANEAFWLEFYGDDEESRTLAKRAYADYKRVTDAVDDARIAMPLRPAVDFIYQRLLRRAMDHDALAADAAREFRIPRVEVWITNLVRGTLANALVRAVASLIGAGSRVRMLKPSEAPVAFDAQRMHSTTIPTRPGLRYTVAASVLPGLAIGRASERRYTPVIRERVVVSEAASGGT